VLGYRDRAEVASGLLLDRARVEEFRRRVVDWYEAYGSRDLPWRRTRDGWAVLVAASMLRQTTVKQVAKVYGEFLRRYPSPHSLLAASEDEVRELIRPLGMEHRRARQIVELARVLVQRFGGRVPCSREVLKELPGVGDYVASEVLLRVCGQVEPLLDRNTVRVVERVFGVRSARRNPYRDLVVRSLAGSLVPEDPELAEKFSFGVFDLARKVCTARKPKCGTCPVRDICSYSARSGER
jgi:A/G-specific adenine glycosylase